MLGYWFVLMFVLFCLNCCECLRVLVPWLVFFNCYVWYIGVDLFVFGLLWFKLLFGFVMCCLCLCLVLMFVFRVKYYYVYYGWQFDFVVSFVYALSCWWFVGFWFLWVYFWVRLFRIGSFIGLGLFRLFDAVCCANLLWSYILGLFSMGIVLLFVIRVMITFACFGLGMDVYLRFVLITCMRYCCYCCSDLGFAG